MTNDFFRATYSAADGYIGKSRPLYFRIATTELEEDMTDEDLADLFEESMQDHFDQNVHPESDDRQVFVEWARMRLQEREDV